MKKKSYDITDDATIKEWQDIEDMVLAYQNSINKIYTHKIEKDSVATENKDISTNVATEYLINKFSPLFKKYLTLLKFGQIDFNDFEMKQFITLFMDDIELKRALGRKKQKSEYKAEIYKKFNFVLETYGQLSEEDIMSDMQLCLLVLAKRYTQTGKNFCAYVYNAYRYEVARHIKNFIKNPINIQYKLLKYEDCINGEGEEQINNVHEDNYYEDATGLPNYTWINGQTCSDVFCSLSTIQRKILIKYYLEDWNDRQIAEETGLHINTINQKRRQAIKIISEKTGTSLASDKRSRKSGKKASLPMI